MNYVRLDLLGWGYIRALMAKPIAEVNLTIHGVRLRFENLHRGEELWGRKSAKKAWLSFLKLIGNSSEEAGRSTTQSTACAQACTLDRREQAVDRPVVRP